MYSFKKSLITVVGLFVLCGAIAALTPLASRGQGGKQQRGLRKFYLTQGQYDGSQALSACAAGYHMASLWEILDPSNLSYDTNLGVALADSGSGPPVVAPGWIRTGFLSNAGIHAADGSVQPGTGNCQTWTSASGGAYGTTAYLPIYAPVGVDVRPGPWVVDSRSCDKPNIVWCVQD